MEGILADVLWILRRRFLPAAGLMEQLDVDHGSWVL